jgi:hypothetical protein
LLLLDIGLLPEKAEFVEFGHRDLPRAVDAGKLPRIRPFVNRRLNTVYPEVHRGCPAAPLTRLPT